MPVPCQAVLVVTGILIAIVGVVAVLGTGCAAAIRQSPSPAAWIDSRPWLRADRLRLARTQLTESVGPIGAFLFLLGGGVLVVSAVAAVFGFGLAALEHPVDWWAFHLSDRLRWHGWARVMNVVTQTGNLPETRTAGVVFSVLLAFVAGRRRWWAPGVLILSVLLVEKYQQSMLATIVDRGHPPTTLGTYPSGGCARLISIYGVILLLVLELTRAGRRTRTVTWTLLWTAAFIEGYSRWYLNKHWVTDVLGGWFYGGLLLAVAVFAGRALVGRREATAAVAEARAETVGSISRN
jgi:membrane-associated phospholipid phosphatase